MGLIVNPGRDIQVSIDKQQCPESIDHNWLPIGHPQRTMAVAGIQIKGVDSTIAEVTDK